MGTTQKDNQNWLLTKKAKYLAEIPESANCLVPFMQKCGAKSPYFYRAMKLLIEDGIITHQKGGTKPKWKLTEKGQKIKQHLIEIINEI